MAHPSLKAQQSERTRTALIASGRALFAANGYARVSAEEVAAAAGVTTGAVYHQFGSKRGLFLAVFEAVEAAVTDRVALAASEHSDPWAGFKAAGLEFIAASVEPEIRQVVLIDGRSVLGWDEWHAIMARYGLGMTRTVVSTLLQAGLLPPLPADALSAALFGALSEAALFAATSETPELARDQASVAVAHLLDALRTFPAPS